MSYKCISFDIDGTLLNTKKELTCKTIASLQKAISHHKIVVLASGRCLPELLDICKQVPGIQYLITTSGSMVYDVENKKVIYSTQMSVDTIHKILELSKERDMIVHLMSTDSIIEKEKGKRLEDYYMGFYQSTYDSVCTYVDNIYEYYFQNEKPYEKINLYHRSIEDREYIYSKLKPLNLALTYAETTTIECSSIEASKGTGLKKICEYTGINLQETIAVGDGDNDMEILKVAGLAIAMGNATDEVKKIADVIVADHNHDGCSEAIEQYLLKDEQV